MKLATSIAQLNIDVSPILLAQEAVQEAQAAVQAVAVQVAVQAAALILLRSPLLSLIVEV